MSVRHVFFKLMCSRLQAIWRMHCKPFAFSAPAESFTVQLQHPLVRQVGPADTVAVYVK